MSVFNFFKPVHGNHYLGNTDATQVYFSLQVYETVYMKASLDLKVENAEVGWKTLRNFSVWDREETKVMFAFVLLSNKTGSPKELCWKQAEPNPESSDACPVTWPKWVTFITNPSKAGTL